MEVPIHEELICAVCSDFFRQPKLLSCAHVFCLMCLRGGCVENCAPRSQDECCVRVNGHGGEDARRSECSNGTDTEGIECPSCRGITQLSAEGVEGLPEPTRFELLLESMSEEEKQRTRDEVHRRLDKSRMVPLQHCEVHDRAREFFCDQCRVFLCLDCLTERHRDHVYRSAASVLPDRLSALRGQLQPAYAFVEKAEGMVEQLSRDQEAILANQKRCKESVQEVFARMHSALEAREKLIQLTIDKYATGKVNAVTEHHHKLTKGKEKVSCCIESVSRLLERAGDLSILQEDQALLEELETQEQLILEVDEEASRAMHSSSYVGFKEDHIPGILKEATKALTLCEFYPESDSGYYASRKIAVEDEQTEEGEDDTYDVLRPGGVDLRYSRSMHHTKRPVVVARRKQEMGEGVQVTIIPEHDLSESPTPTDSPSSNHRSSLSEETSSCCIDDGLHLIRPTQTYGVSPKTPLRFSSLLSPLPILEPLKVFDKLAGSRKESVHPCGICIIANDSIVVSDVKNHCLRMIASNGKFIDVIGGEGKGSGLFEEPCGMCLDNRGNILVTQRQNPRIQRFTPSGKFVGKFGQKTLLGSNLSEPWSVCVASSGEIYVSDWDKSCIHIFQDGGRYLCTLGSKIKGGVGVKESLLFPGGIAYDSHGRILVTDRGNHCVWLFQSDGSIVSRFGSKGHAPGDLYYPYGIAVTPEGRIVVSESGNHRISMFSPSRQFLHCFGRQGGQPGFFDHPRNIAFTSVGDLVVVDESNERLQVFSLP